MNVLKKIKPVLVLSIICTLICALLIVTYNLTYVDTSGVLTDNLKAGCIAADGEGEYALSPIRRRQSWTVKNSVISQR